MRPPIPSFTSGFSLIELVVALAIMGILLSLALPATSLWLANSRLRNQSESILSGLRLARGEALKRNSVVRFQLVTDMTSSCNITANGNQWLLSHGDPTNACDLPESLLAAVPTANAPYAVPPVILLKSATELQQTTGQTTLAVVANGMASGISPDNIACFTGTGALARTAVASGFCTAAMSPSTSAPATVTIDITDPGAGTCFSDASDPATGDVRCLRIQVTSWGDIRLCDPGLAPAKHVNDPRICS